MTQLIKGKAYAHKQVDMAHLTERDLAALERNGWVVTNDLHGTGPVFVVHEIDHDTLTSRPVGYAKDKEKLSHVLTNVRRGRVKNRAVRPDDIVDLNEICKRTGRKKGNVVAKWKKDPAWPKPVLKLGMSDGYYWPEVKAFIQAKGWPLRKGWAKWDHERSST